MKTRELTDVEGCRNNLMNNNNHETFVFIHFIKCRYTFSRMQMKVVETKRFLISPPPPKKKKVVTVK
jgi:hypothetical protein